MKVAIVWQRFLPCHATRLVAARHALERAGGRLLPVEVASQDAAYGFPRETFAELEPIVRVLGDTNYHAHNARTIETRVRACLERESPDFVFCPATAFPEGMAGVRYRCRSGARVAIMDDAWEASDRRGPLTRAAKRLIHRNVDAAFVPAPSHAAYYRSLGFPDDRIFFGVDVVDNHAFETGVTTAGECAAAARLELGLPARYFLCVTRLLPRKGVDTLLEAYSAYRAAMPRPWGLVIVGHGPHAQRLRDLADGVPDVIFAGPRFGADLFRHYALAGALVVPSERDPWALVVNEGAASSLPLIVSRGCGAAATLVADGVNGWTFAPGDTRELAALLARLDHLADDRRREMGEASHTLVAAWSPERFTAGLLRALSVSRRPPAGLLPDTLTRFWQGRVERVAAGGVGKRAARRVLIVQQRLTAYRVPFFEALKQQMTRRGLDLSVIYGAAREEERMRGDDATLAWGTRVPRLQLGFRGWGPVLLRIPRADRAGLCLCVLPHENRSLTSLWYLLRPRKRGWKIALWGHGANFADTDQYSLSNRVRAWTARRADWWFAYTSRSVERVLSYGYPRTRITCVDNAIDTRRLAADRAGISARELQELRAQLGLDGATVGIALGSLHARRRLDFLFAAACRIHDARPDFALLVIGDGAERGCVAQFARKHPWCRWVGALQGREKARHLALGSILLNPGLVGLGILDGFACGLPLVTTDCGIHSPEIAYLEHERNGLIVADDLVTFSGRVLDLLADEPRLARMAAACREDAQLYTVERMAEAFAAGIIQALASASPRHNAGRRRAATSDQGGRS